MKRISLDIAACMRGGNRKQGLTRDERSLSLLGSRSFLREGPNLREEVLEKVPAPIGQDSLQRRFFSGGPSRFWRVCFAGKKNQKKRGASVARAGKRAARC